MAKGTFDGAARLFICDLGVTTLDAQIDLYSDWKEWVRTGSNAKYAPMFRTVGGDPTSVDEAIGRYYFLLNGWKIRPQEANHVLLVDGNVKVDGGGSPFVPTLGNYNVMIETKFSNQAVQVLTGAGGFSSTFQEMLSRINSVVRGNATFEALPTGVRKIQFLDEFDAVIETHEISASGRVVT